MIEYEYIEKVEHVFEWVCPECGEVNEVEARPGMFDCEEMCEHCSKEFSAKEFEER